jgi:hypothetical protein
MKNDTNAGGLPTLVSDVISDSKHYIDNLYCGHLEETEETVRSGSSTEQTSGNFFTGSECNRSGQVERNRGTAQRTGFNL